ncbi:MAG: inositol monophosphatase family protein [Candidatus Hydrothermarchaeota archaeon]
MIKVISKEMKVATRAAKEAGKMLMEYYGKVDRNYRYDGSTVTEADLEVERIIKHILSREFPDHSFLGEESGIEKGDSEYLWVIDPLDGTTNFTMRNPFFNTSIALTFRREPILGVVYNPYEDEIFQAERGKGAFLNGDRIRVSEEDEIKNSIITFSHGGDKRSVEIMIDIFGKLKLINGKVRQIGAAALELCFVACGRVEAFFMPGPNLWDVLAGALIVKEANGRVTDFKGNSFKISSSDILASNGKIHGELIEIIKERGKAKNF